jgi:hypothetical protein
MNNVVNLKPEIWIHPQTGKKIYFYAIHQLEEMQRLKRMRDAAKREDANEWGQWNGNIGLRYSR